VKIITQLEATRQAGALGTQRVVDVHRDTAGLLEFLSDAEGNECVWSGRPSESELRR
jgi:hypothetical protein